MADDAIPNRKDAQGYYQDFAIYFPTDDGIIPLTAALAARSERRRQESQNPFLNEADAFAQEHKKFAREVNNVQAIKSRATDASWLTTREEIRKQAAQIAASLEPDDVKAAITNSKNFSLSSTPIAPAPRPFAAKPAKNTASKDPVLLEDRLAQCLVNPTTPPKQLATLVLDASDNDLATISNHWRAHTLSSLSWHSNPEHTNDEVSRERFSAAYKKLHEVSPHPIADTNLEATLRTHFNDKNFQALAETVVKTWNSEARFNELKSVDPAFREEINKTLLEQKEKVSAATDSDSKTAHTNYIMATQFLNRSFSEPATAQKKDAATPTSPAVAPSPRPFIPPMPYADSQVPNLTPRAPDTGLSTDARVALAGVAGAAAVEPPVIPKTLDEPKAALAAAETAPAPRPFIPPIPDAAGTPEGRTSTLASSSAASPDASAQTRGSALAPALIPPAAEDSVAVVPVPRPAAPGAGTVKMGGDPVTPPSAVDPAAKDMARRLFPEEPALKDSKDRTSGTIPPDRSLNPKDNPAFAAAANAAQAAERAAKRAALEAQAKSALADISGKAGALLDKAVAGGAAVASVAKDTASKLVPRQRLEMLDPDVKAKKDKELLEAFDEWVESTQNQAQAAPAPRAAASPPAATLPVVPVTPAASATAAQAPSTAPTPREKQAEPATLASLIKKASPNKADAVNPYNMNIKTKGYTAISASDNPNNWRVDLAAKGIDSSAVSASGETIKDHIRLDMAENADKFVTVKTDARVHVNARDFATQEGRVIRADGKGEVVFTFKEDDMKGGKQPKINAHVEKNGKYYTAVEFADGKKIFAEENGGKAAKLRMQTRDDKGNVTGAHEVHADHESLKELASASPSAPSLSPPSHAAPAISEAQPQAAVSYTAPSGIVMQQGPCTVSAPMCTPSGPKQGPIRRLLRR